MEFTEEFITEQKFSTEQMTAINEVIKDAQDASGIAELKKGWDGTALKNADNIIDDAVKATQTANNFTLARDKDEKLGDWNVRYSKALNDTKQTELDTSISEYNDKVKNFQGDANLKAEIITLNDKLDPLLKQKADYDELLNSGVKDKYEALLIKNASDTKALAYSSAKPAFHKDIDSRIVNHEWTKFVAEIDAKYDLVEINGEWVACEKDNPKHAQKPLKDLIKDNEDLTKLIDGRQQDGPNASQAKTETIDGVPFGVPKDVSNKDLTALVHAQLAKEGLEKHGHTSEEYSKRFQELFTNARGKGQKTAA